MAVKDVYCGMAGFNIGINSNLNIKTYYETQINPHSGHSDLS